MAGYHERLAGDMLRIIFIENIGTVNVMRIIFICYTAISLNANCFPLLFSASQSIARQLFFHPNQYSMSTSFFSNWQIKQ